MSEWKIAPAPVAGTFQWEVYRLIDESKPMVYSNVESKGFFTSQDEAQALADKLNAGE